MKFQDRIKSFSKSTKNLKSVLKKPKNADTRDLAIKRFELCFELAWKSVRDYLKEKGLQCKSPKDAIKEAFKYGLIRDDAAWYDMLEDRNLAVHTYEEQLAERIYANLSKYLPLLEALLKTTQGAA